MVRTTSLVASFEAAYPGAHLTWLTGPESREYLEALPSIDRVLPLDAGSLEILHAERFDVLACLELSDEATALAVNIDAEKRLGFGRDKRGVVFNSDHILRTMKCSQHDAQHYTQYSINNCKLL